MATETLHYHLIKPVSADRVAVSDINDNSDTIDGYLFQANERAAQMADDYNASETYNTGDYVRRENYLYKCNTDNTTGTWDVTKWDRVKVMEEITQGGGGGSSTLAGLNDVNISSPTDGQALVYDNATQKWVNRAGGGGSSTFAGLNDVDVAGVANNDIARFNSSTQKWEKSSDLTDLELAVSQISASTLGITNGHTILDSNGTAMAQEDVLQFASGYVEDDSVNGKTVYIEMIRISQANYDTLKANGQLKPGAKYFIYDAQPVAVNASNLPYDNNTSTKEAIDEQPLNISDSIVLNTTNFSLQGRAIAYYDRKTKRVWGTVSARATSGNLGTSDAYFIIASAYRPKTEMIIPVIIKIGTEDIMYYGRISTDGKIKQDASSMSNSIFAYFEYYI